MKTTMNIVKGPNAGNSPVLKTKLVTPPDISSGHSTAPNLGEIIENTPKLKIAEVLVINVKV